MASLPPLSDPLWDRLVTGSITHKFSLFAANMAVARAVRLAADPAQKPAMIAELHAFFARYATQIADDLQALR